MELFRLALLSALCLQSAYSVCVDDKGDKHEEGSVFKSPDGCNKCFCRAGRIGCTKKACISRQRSLLRGNLCVGPGGTYRDGESYFDGCNQCVCRRGLPLCTLQACRFPKLPCFYNGQLYRDGQSFNATDDCNTCTCRNGNVDCTEMACRRGCVDPSTGKFHPDGDSFPSADGCNTCGCSDGLIYCTERACL